MAVRISYSKQFISGNLAGISVSCGYTVPDHVHAALHMRDLNLLTKQNPGSDCVTGARFWVYNVGSADV